MAHFNKTDNEVVKAFDAFRKTFLENGKSIFDPTIQIAVNDINNCLMYFSDEAIKNKKNKKNQDEALYDALKNDFLNGTINNNAPSNEDKHILAHAEWLWALPWDDVGNESTTEQLKKTLPNVNIPDKFNNDSTTSLFPQGIIEGGNLKGHKVDQIKAYLAFFKVVFDNKADKTNEELIELISDILNPTITDQNELNS